MPYPSYNLDERNKTNILTKQQIARSEFDMEKNEDRYVHIMIIIFTDNSISTMSNFHIPSKSFSRSLSIANSLTSQVLNLRAPLCSIIKPMAK